jgi:hypothetical protein
MVRLRIVIERVLFAVCTVLDESVTVTLALLVPPAVGVPVMAPVPALIDNPAGSPVADQCNGVVPPEAATVWL